jgi:hypothetical protein
MGAGVGGQVGVPNVGWANPGSSGIAHVSGMQRVFRIAFGVLEMALRLLVALGDCLLLDLYGPWEGVQDDLGHKLLRHFGLVVIVVGELCGEGVFFEIGFEVE